MLGKFIKHYKYKKMVKVGASFILDEFAKIVGETIEHFDKEGKIKTPLQKEVLKFETTAFLFWLFRNTDVFPEAWHRPLLDETHHQYYEELRKRGYNFKLRQKVNDDVISRYKEYDEVLGKDNNFPGVGAKFISFLSERSNTELDIEDMMIPLYLTKKITPKFHEWREVMKN